jgi:hypothetical protein
MKTRLVVLNSIFVLTSLGCSKAQFGEQKNKEFKGVSVLEKNAVGSDVGSQGKSEMVADQQPSLVIDTVKPPPLAVSKQFSLSRAAFALEADKPVEVQWTLDVDLPDLDVFTISVIGPDEKVILQQEVVSVGTQKGSVQSFKFEFPKELNALYTYSIGGYNKDRSYISPTQGTIIVDTEAPKGRVYLGAQGSANPCAKPPVVSAYVATRVVPSQICLDDQKGLGSGVDKYCIVQNASSQAIAIPGSADACWKDPSAFLPQVFLSSENEGMNYFHLFIKDKVGNVGRDTPQLIKIVPSEPPKVGIVSPTSSELAASKWLPGQDKVLRWKVSDQDTLALDIRIVVSLINRENHEDFKTLACSFSDAMGTPQKLCPDVKVAASPNIVRRADGTGEYRFKVDPSWDLNKPYILVVTAIDKAGNASVISSSEINADWEVIAGRSYSGFGGTGSTLQATETYSGIAADKLGQVYNTSGHRDGNTKIRALDGRSCRFSKGVGKPATAFDCDDIIESDEPILSGAWTYVEHRNSFYSVYAGIVNEIDFIARTNKKVMGAGSASLPVGIETKPMASLAAIGGLMPYFSYEPKSKSTFFMASNRLYRIDENQMVSFVVGSGTAAAGSPAEDSKKASELDLPSISGNGFIVTDDGRLIYSAAAPKHWYTGGGAALVYVIDNITWGKPDQVATLMVLGGPTAPTGPYAPDYHRMSYWYNAAYSQKESAFYYSSAWTGLFKMKIPAKGSTEDKYTTEPVVLSHVGGAYRFFSYMIALVPNTTIAYMSDSYKGSTLQIDTASKEFNYYTGSRELIGARAEQAENVILAAPRYFHRISDSEIYFSDNTGLKKANYDSGSGWMVTGLSPKLASAYVGAVRIFESISKVVQISVASLSFAPLTDIANTFSETVVTLPTANGASYPLQFGHSNSAVAPKLLAMSTSWDGQRVHSAQLFVAEYDPVTNTSKNSDVNLLAGYTLGSPYCGENKVTACAQSSTVPDARGGQHFVPGTYHIPQVAYFYFGNVQQTVAAFSADDKIAYTCGNNKFIAIELESKKIFEFTARGTDGSSLYCPILGAAFQQLNGEIYYAYNGQFYKLNMSNVFSRNEASFVQMNYGKFPAGFRPNQFQVVPNGTKNWLYTTDLQSHRLLRKEVTP